MIGHSAFLSVLCFLFIALQGVCQVNGVTTIRLTDTVNQVAIDRPGDLYLLSKGGIKRYDKDGVILSTYADEIPTLFDPRDGSRLFAYFRNEQTYRYLNPSFEIVREATIDSVWAIEPWLATTSGDNNLWILDAADWSIKKVNPNTGQTITEAALEDFKPSNKSDVRYAKEYQGFVFIWDHAKGILIYNGHGKKLKHVEVKNLRGFNFVGEELYYISNNTITFLNLFTAETRTVQSPYPCTVALLTDERFYCILPSLLQIITDLSFSR